MKTFVSDHLGTVINAEVTNEHKVTGVYGEVLGAKPKMSKSQNPVLYAYTGRQYDSESGLYYYRARSYDSQSGRFMSKDPKGVSSGDLNLYRYVGNKPEIGIDPFGFSTRSANDSAYGGIGLGGAGGEQVGPSVANFLYNFADNATTAGPLLLPPGVAVVKELFIDLTKDTPPSLQNENTPYVDDGFRFYEVTPPCN